MSRSDAYGYLAIPYSLRFGVLIAASAERAVCSRNQLQNGDAITLEDNPVASELKAASSIDVLIAEKTMRSPDFIKIDVDGIELAILESATNLLSGPERPDSLQVEVESSNDIQIDEFMADHGWDLKERDATMAGTKRLKRSAVIEEIPHNVIYEPRASC